MKTKNSDRSFISAVVRDTKSKQVRRDAADALASRAKRARPFLVQALPLRSRHPSKS